MWILENPDTSQVFFKCLWSGYERGKETPSGHHTVQDETHGQEGQLRMMHVASASLSSLWRAVLKL